MKDNTCQAVKCTRQAVYHVSVKVVAGQAKPEFERNYCPAHTRGLGHEIERKIGTDRPLHEVLEVEHVNA
jgi:hypothetical protein